MCGMKETTVYLPEPLKQGVERLARQRSCSEAEVIRQAIRDAISRPKPCPGIIPGDERAVPSAGTRADTPSGDHGAPHPRGNDVPSLAAGARADTPIGPFVAVEAGWEHTCGLLTDGAVACWGWNDEGQADAPGGRFSAVAAGGEHSCGLRTDGTLICWGDDEYGKSAAPEGRFRDVAGGGWHACGLRTDATVTCWGLNEVGKGEPMWWALSDHLPAYYWSGTGYAPAERFTAISVGGGHACGIRFGGTLTCWGYNGRGQVDMPDEDWGDPSETIPCWGVPREERFPCATYGDVGQANAPTGRFSAVAAGGWHSCGIRFDGTATCWGGRSGVGYRLQVDAPGGQFSAITTGGNLSCGLRIDGTATCWGGPPYTHAPESVQWTP